MHLLPEISVKSWMLFKAVYEEGSVTKAARESGLTQSGVSRSIAMLEKKLNIKLFIRSNYRLLATASADGLYMALKPIMDGFKDFENDIISIRDYGNSRLRIAAIPGLSFDYVPKVITLAFREIKNRNITFDMQSSSELVSSIESDHIDIGFLVLPVTSKTLHVEEFMQSEAVCILHKQHPLAKKKQITITDFADQDLVVVHQPNLAAQEHLSMLKKRQIKVRNITECNIASMCSFVANRMGIGLINHISVTEQLSPQSPIVIRPFTPKIVYRFAMVYKTKWAKSKTLTALRKVITENQPTIK